MTNAALLGAGVLGDDDLTLLQWPAGHPLMAKRAQLACIFRHRHFQIFRMIGTCRHMFECAANIALATGAMADLTSHDLADIGSVMNAVGPFRELRRMA